jgi:hypothetical protein
MGDIVESDDSQEENWPEPKPTPAKKGFMTDGVAGFIAILTVTFFFAYVSLITYLSYKTTGAIDLALVNLVIGYVGGLASAIVMFYFGTSKGSNDKNDLMDRMQRQIERNKPEGQ